MKTIITPAERLQLLGLLTLAEIYCRKAHEVRDGINDLLDARGEERDQGHVDDAVWDDGRRDADQLLERLNIAVEPAVAEPKE